MTLPYVPQQEIDYKIEYWDTPFSPLYGDVASNGLRVDVYDIPADFGTTFLAMNLTNDTAWDAALNATAVLSNGRMPNAIGYWAGGAPGYHGATTNRRVAYRIQGILRSEAARSWFSAGASFSMRFGVAGSGKMRITVNGTDALTGDARLLSEATFLTTGQNTSGSVTLATNDVVKIYYVQDEDAWGGFVVKPMLGGTTLQIFRDAPVLGCGLISYGTNPVLQTFTEVLNVNTDIVPNQARRASMQVPLMNTSTGDGVGWEWSRDLTDTTGHLRLHRFTAPLTVDIRRQRLIRISMGFRNMETGVPDLKKVFTGFTDDFEVRNGVATITCLGFEQRLADQYVKNYPDRISYMTFGYKEMSGTQEPVYNITAYDNWPIEQVFRDLMMRAGIDASRCWAPVKVRQADGSTLTVVM